MVSATSPPVPEAFHQWHDWLRERYTSELTFAEYRRGVEALSQNYTGTRNRIGKGGHTFSGKAKRAAFAAFYSPLHFLTVWQIIHALELEELAPKRILDLGAGFGAASSAWSHASSTHPRVLAVDKSEWVTKEARGSFDKLGVSARVVRAELERTPMPTRTEVAIAAYTVNELDPESRDRLLPRCLKANASLGLLVVEPIAHRAFEWWEAWEASFLEAGGRSDSWTFELDLPEPIEKVDRAVGFSHRIQKARSLWIGEQSATR